MNDDYDLDNEHENDKDHRDKTEPNEYEIEFLARNRGRSTARTSNVFKEYIDSIPEANPLNMLLPLARIDLN